MKKILISLFLIFALCPAGSFAEDIVFQRISVEDSFAPLGGAEISAGEKIPSPPSDFPAFFSNSDLEQYLCDALTNADALPDVIDGLEQLKINKTDFDDMYFDIALKHPELFLKTGYTSLKHNEKTGVVQSIRPKYVVSSWEEVLAGREILAAGVKEYTQATKGYATDLEKLLVIHDKMVADCTYDMNAMDKNNAHLVPDSRRHAIGVFRDKVAVCQGYSQALYMIAKELGIEMDFCFSEEKNHMWNYVKLDGKWYHMDMTNDDPAPSGGEAMHTYFMVSDDGLEESIHGSNYRSFEKGVIGCNDTSYETDHIFNMEVPFTAVRGEDGFFHAPLEIDVEEGIWKEIDFKSATLYTGPAISLFYDMKIANGNKNLYFISYPTRNLKNTVHYIRYDNKNQMQKHLFDLSEDELFINNIAPEKGVPMNMPVTFSAFLWDADTLTPHSAKAVWTQN